MPFKRESKTFFQCLINLCPKIWTPDTYYLLTGTPCRASSIHHSKPTLLPCPPCSGPWRPTSREFVKGVCWTQPIGDPSGKLESGGRVVTVSPSPAFFPLGHHGACVPLLKSTAPFLGSLRPMGSNGSLLLSAMKYHTIPHCSPVSWLHLCKKSLY